MLLTLVADPACEPVAHAALVVDWEDGGEASAHLSLPAYMRKRLVQIRAEHAQWAYDLGKTQIGGIPVSEHLKGGASLSMWWTSLIYERHPKLSPALYTIYRLRALELLLEEKSCDSLVLAGGDHHLKAAVEHLCKARGMRFQVCGSSGRGPRPPLIKRLYGLLPAPLRAPIRYLHWLCAIKRKLPHVKKRRLEESQQSATIITYYPNIDLRAAARGRFVSRYWEDLHKIICRDSAAPLVMRWLFIRFPSPQLSLADCVKLRDTFAFNGKDGATFDYLEEFISPRDQLQSIWRWLRLCVKSALIERSVSRLAHFKNSSVDFWPYIREQWAESFRGWRCLERALQLKGFERYWGAPQKWILFPLENCPWERMATQSAREKGVSPRIYGAQHSIVRPADFRYFDSPDTFRDPECSIFQPDIIAGNGEWAISQWQEAGVPAERLRKLEALRYLYLAQDMRATREPAENLPPVPGEPVSPDWSKTLLVLTSFFADETDAHLKLLQKTLEAGTLQGWRVILKPHPYLPVSDWFESLSAELGAGVEISGEPLPLLLKPGAHAWASNSTTAALEAVLRGLPTMVMEPVGDFDLSPVQGIPGIARTGTVQDVAAALAIRKAPEMPAGYLDLNPGLAAWKNLLGLNHCEKQAITIACYS